MPLVEIEDQVLAKLKSEAEAAAPYRAVWGKILSGKNRTKALELVAEDFPDAADVKAELNTIKSASQPMLDEIAQIKKEFSEYKETQEKAQQEREDQARKANVDRTIARSHSSLKKQGWDDDGIKKIEELMVERGINDYDVAAAYIKSKEPPPAPLINSYEGKDLNWFNPGDDEPDHKLLMNDPKKFKTEMLKKFFADKRAGNVSAWAA